MSSTLQAATAFQAPRGTRDVLPPESARWEALVALFATRMGRAGYGLVITPMFEDMGVFERVGEATDIVRKEMYDFRDKGGRHIALRPEGTASVVRAYVQHRPVTPFKTWYVAPNFRYEAPQAGRYRQHHQLGAEALGSDDPDLDVEIIDLAWGVYSALGLKRVRLLLNSMGDATCRPPYRKLLLEYLERRADELCDEHRATYAVNPLRVLDCKREECRRVTADAPWQLDHLCEACQAHFDRVREGLDSVGIPATIELRLVRGLDYYTRTTFEFAAEALESAQNAVGGGGRYDGLAEALGGPPTPGIGFGMGIERILLACDAENTFPVPEGRLDAFVVDATGGRVARDLTHELREAGVRVDRAFDDRSIKAGMKAAGRSGARFALVIGADELAKGVVGVKPLLEKGEQVEVPREALAAHLRRALAREA
jgi:histidyl-tRNA synthetase